MLCYSQKMSLNISQGFFIEVKSINYASPSNIYRQGWIEKKPPRGHIAPLFRCIYKKYRKKLLITIG